MEHSSIHPWHPQLTHLTAASIHGIHSSHSSQHHMEHSSIHVIHSSQHHTELSIHPWHPQLTHPSTPSSQWKKSHEILIRFQQTHNFLSFQPHTASPPAFLFVLHMPWQWIHGAFTHNFTLYVDGTNSHLEYFEAPFSSVFKHCTLG